MERNYTKTKREYNPIKLGCHSKKSRKCWLVLMLAIGLFTNFTLISCANDDENEELSKPNEPTLELSDISGVWVNPSNSLYYIAIYPSGKYTYCFNNRLIGSGRCSLDNKTLYLYDEYTYASDKVCIDKMNNKLTVYGNVTNMKSSKEYVSNQFIYSSESLSPSIAGVKKTSTGGLNYYYDNLNKEISFISDMVFQYVYTGRNKYSNQYKTITHYTWRYVYRKPYTYGIKLNQEDYVVEIFDFPFTYTTGWGTLDLDPDDFIVEQ